MGGTVRGELWTVAGGVYAWKPRPALIVQDDRLRDTGSVTNRVLPVASGVTARRGGTVVRQGKGSVNSRSRKVSGTVRIRERSVTARSSSWCAHSRSSSGVR